MDHKEHMGKLEELYQLAVKTENIEMALVVITEIIASTAVQAQLKGEKNSEDTEYEAGVLISNALREAAKCDFTNLICDGMTEKLVIDLKGKL